MFSPISFRNKPFPGMFRERGNRRKDLNIFIMTCMSVTVWLPQTLWCLLNIQLPQFIIRSHLFCLNHLDNCGASNRRAVTNSAPFLQAPTSHLAFFPTVTPFCFTTWIGPISPALVTTLISTPHVLVKGIAFHSKTH